LQISDRLWIEGHCLLIGWTNVSLINLVQVSKTLQGILTLVVYRYNLQCYLEIDLASNGTKESVKKLHVVYFFTNYFWEFSVLYKQNHTVLNLQAKKKFNP
jgi:hypothetical protein